MIKPTITAQRIVKKKLSDEEWQNSQGRIATVNLTTQQFEIGDELLPTIKRARKFDDGELIAIRIGFDA